MPAFPSKPRKLTVAGGPKANRHKVSGPRKIVTSGPKEKCSATESVRWSEPRSKGGGYGYTTVRCTRAKGHNGLHTGGGNRW